MMTRVLIIGGYGNFGQFISQELANVDNIELIIAGRNVSKTKLTATKVAINKTPETIYLDINKNLDEVLNQIKPNVVIHTSGPFQSQSYFVAEKCIDNKCHYIDLADAREFVANISTLNTRAQSAGVLAISGASSVPTLTSAILDHYNKEFKQLNKIDYAISSAQRTNQGLATTRAILGYVGKPFNTLRNGKTIKVYGWQELRIRKWWKLNTRCSGNCDVPDLELFPSRYPDLKTIRFQAGIESKAQHLGLYLLSWLVRAKLLTSVQPLAKTLLKISRWFDPLGTNDSGFQMQMWGASKSGEPKTITFSIAAKNGDGLYIPCIPAILLVKKIANDEIPLRGALPCVGLISLDEYLSALSHLDIQYASW